MVLFLVRNESIYIWNSISDQTLYLKGWLELSYACILVYGRGVERNRLVTGTYVMYSPRHPLQSFVAEYPLTLALERTLLNFPGPTPTLTGFETLRTSEPFPDEA